MGITISGQTGLLLSAALLGFVLGGLYDVFRLIRTATRCGWIALFFLDILYWLICSFSVFIFLLLLNQGKVRLLVILIGAFGAALYYNTIGMIFIKRAEKIDRTIKKHTKAAGMAIIKPVYHYGGIAASNITQKSHTAGRFIKKETKLFKIRLKVKPKMLYNLLRPARKPKSDEK